MSKDKKCNCDNLYTCIYCGKKINVRIEPWDYNFPSNTYHIGCKIKFENNNQ